MPDEVIDIKTGKPVESLYLTDEETGKFMEDLKSLAATLKSHII